MKKEELIDIFQIVERANNMGIMFFDRTSLKMNLNVTHQEFNLRLEALLSPDDVSFAHDVVGIQDHIDREDKRVGDEFLPGCSSL